MTLARRVSCPICSFNVCLFQAFALLVLNYGLKPVGCLVTMAGWLGAGQRVRLGLLQLVLLCYLSGFQGRYL
jgi:hypothetical protein